jgi:type IV secretory pathway TrbF-like protein
VRVQVRDRVGNAFARTDFEDLEEALATAMRWAVEEFVTEVPIVRVRGVVSHVCVLTNCAERSGACSVSATSQRASSLR